VGHARLVTAARGGEGVLRELASLLLGPPVPATPGESAPRVPASPPADPVTAPAPGEVG
jgi:hypothetical protein